MAAVPPALILYRIYQPDKVTIRSRWRNPVPLCLAPANKTQPLKLDRPNKTRHAYRLVSSIPTCWALQMSDTSKSTIISLPLWAFFRQDRTGTLRYQCQISPLGETPILMRKRFALCSLTAVCLVTMAKALESLTNPSVRSWTLRLSFCD